jgi:hypothetical protein
MRLKREGTTKKRKRLGPGRYWISKRRRVVAVFSFLFGLEEILICLDD